MGAGFDLGPQVAMGVGARLAQHGSRRGWLLDGRCATLRWCDLHGALSPPCSGARSTRRGARPQPAVTHALRLEDFTWARRAVGRRRTKQAPRPPGGPNPARDIPNPARAPPPRLHAGCVPLRATPRAAPVPSRPAASHQPAWPSALEPRQPVHQCPRPGLRPTPSPAAARFRRACCGHVGSISSNLSARTSPVLLAPPPAHTVSRCPPPPWLPRKVVSPGPMLRSAPP